ncbi:hypothetical protein U6W31_11515, partial [Brucella melitensis]|uniref:hypothetical protein n=1 Tax=Brucella melitensis TaxID=29459 RepID=UPI00398BB916
HIYFKKKPPNPKKFFFFFILYGFLFFFKYFKTAEHAGRKGLKQQKRQDWRPTLSLLYFKFNPGGLSKAAP